MAATLKDIQRWNPEKITTAVLHQAFAAATQTGEVDEASIVFAQGLKQKFKSLLLASLGFVRVTPAELNKILAAPSADLEVEARHWRIRYAQLTVWLDEHSSSPAYA